MASDERNGETFTYQVSADESLSEGVVAAVSETASTPAVPSSGSGQEEIEPLFSAVDPDALDAVFDGSDGRRGEVTFTYHGYEVSVRSEGLISLSRADPPVEVASD